MTRIKMGNRYMIRNIVQASRYPSVPRIASPHTAYLVCLDIQHCLGGVLATVPVISHSKCHTLSKYNFFKALGWLSEPGNKSVFNSSVRGGILSSCDETQQIMKNEQQ